MATAVRPSSVVYLLHPNAPGVAASSDGSATGEAREPGDHRAETIRIGVAEVRHCRGHIFQALARRLESPACGGLRPGGIEVVFPDYPLTGTPVYLRGEVRVYARRLQAVCPAWFYLLATPGDGLLTLTLARLENVRAVQADGSPRAAVAFCRREFQEFFLEQSRLMRPLFTRFGLGRAAYHCRLAELSRRFGLTEPGDWAEPG